MPLRCDTRTEDTVERFADGDRRHIGGSGPDATTADQPFGLNDLNNDERFRHQDEFTRPRVDGDSV